MLKVHDEAVTTTEGTHTVKNRYEWRAISYMFTIKWMLFSRRLEIKCKDLRFSLPKGTSKR